MQPDTDQRAAGMRVVERRLLAEEIGQEQDLVVRRYLSGEPVEMQVDRQAGGFGVGRLAAGPVAHDPVEEAATRRHAAIGKESPGTMW
jgi:hypothetical protein